MLVVVVLLRQALLTMSNQFSLCFKMVSEMQKLLNINLEKLNGVNTRGVTYIFVNGTANNFCFTTKAHCHAESIEAK